MLIQSTYILTYALCSKWLHGIHQLIVNTSTAEWFWNISMVTSKKNPKTNNLTTFKRKCKVFINTGTQSIFIWQPLIITINIQDFVDFKLLNPGLYIKIIFLMCISFLLVMQYVQASSSHVFHNTASNFWAVCWHQEPLFQKKNPSTLHLACTHAVGTPMNRAHLSYAWLSQMFLYWNNKQ